MSLNLFQNEPAIPDANQLLSMKMLSQANPEAFGDLQKKSTLFLSSALGLLRNDDYLKIKYGGSNISAAMQLAPILKAKAEQLHFDARFDPVAKVFQQSAFEEGLGGLSANLKPSNDILSFEGSGADTKLKIKLNNKKNAILIE